MVGWHDQLNGHEFEQTLDDEGQGSLECCSQWGHKGSKMTEPLNNHIKCQEIKPLPLPEGIQNVLEERR